MTPSEAVAEIQECLSENLGIDNLCVRVLLRDYERLKAELELLHPRVIKLAKSGKRFIVIGEHEPYFMAAYAMIRDQEMKQGTWTEEDRVEYAAAQLSAKESSDE